MGAIQRACHKTGSSRRLPVFCISTRKTVADVQADPLAQRRGLASRWHPIATCARPIAFLAREEVKAVSTAVSP